MDKLLLTWINGIVVFFRDEAVYQDDWGVPPAG